MLPDEFSEKLDRFAHGIIHRKAKQLIGRAGFTKQDRKDIEHDLILRLLQALRSFDPARAHRNAFITTVIERSVANILRDKRAEKRDHRRICSLNIVIGEEEDETPIELGDTISQRELDVRLGQARRIGHQLSQLKQDLQEAIDKLPDALRDLAERLKTQNVSEIARDLGVPRTTVHHSVRRLRQRFENTGLKDYL